MNKMEATTIKRHYSGTPWEKSFGYCRLVIAGNVIEVSGTTAVNESGQIVGEGSMKEQTAFILEKIEKALFEVCASRRNVTRTRLFRLNR